MAITRASTTIDGTQGNGRSGNASLSGDGNFVAFDTTATNLGVTPDASGSSSIFLKNLTTGLLTRISTDSDGNPLTDQNFAPSLTPDVTAVAFVTGAPTLIGGGSPRQVVVKSLVTGEVRVASSTADGTRANADVTTPSLSDDGRMVAFGTAASNLVPDDTNQDYDVFVKNLDTGAIIRASTAADGTQANGTSISYSMAGDGRSVAFHSGATNLVTGDANGRADVFVKNLTTGAVVNASTAADGTQGNDDSYNATLSRDGTLVAFVSDADNLVAGDTNGRSDVFVKNLTTGAITRVSTSLDGTQGNADAVLIPTISADGTKVAFVSRATNLVPGDTNLASDTFVKDLTTGAIVRVSTAADGTQGNGPSNGSIPALSSDGSRIAFDSQATNLVPGDTNNNGDVFVSDTVCFASGTRIRTMGGETAVEALRVGDFVVTASGQRRPIRWIGSQTVDCRSHPKPGAVLPIRIAPGALGENRPTRDLWVSPRHAICLDLLGEVLVPADALINGATITQESVETVTYWHVELDSHDLLIAEGVAAESYLDLGNRGFFAGAAVGPDDEVPGGRATRAQSCRPFAEGDSPIVAFARERLRARAVALGWTAQPDPVAGLHAVADGQVIAPSVDGTTVSLRLPAGCGDVWLVSRTTVPALVGESDDRRRLGVNLRGLTIEDGGALRHTIGLDDARLGAGFHPVQGKAEAPYRWTRGKALLPAGLWADCAGPVTLRLELGGERLLRWQAPERPEAPAALRAPLTVSAASQLRPIKVA